MIAIKELSERDISEFNSFCKMQRKELFKLELADLVSPHESLAVVAYRKKGVSNALDEFGEKYKFYIQECEKDIYTISRYVPHKMPDNSSFLFSGYVFYDGNLYIGEHEVYANIDDLNYLRHAYGEFNLLKIRNNEVILLNDYFNMCPWFYYVDETVFVVSNSYHMLLLILESIGITLKMNISRSRVNVITSGFNYGCAFTNDLDVRGCRILSPFETLIFSRQSGVIFGKTLLGEEISAEFIWNEEVYEDYIRKAAKEIEENCEAVLKYERFKRVVVDISGGFDSRIVLAAITRLPKYLRKKVYTYTRGSKTKDDMETAATVTNMFDFPNWTYGNEDASRICINENYVFIPNVSRTLGTFAVNSHLYCARYYDTDTLELTGGLGDACFGYKRIRGELDYGLGDKRLLARMGGCYLHNSVKQLKCVFDDQAEIINRTLSKYKNCNCLFKKIHVHYVEFRNRFNFGSAHLIEHNNFRIPMAFSRYALMAKMMYFTQYNNNIIPDEKISFDILNELNPIMTTVPFASNNNDVLPNKKKLLKPVNIEVIADRTIHQCSFVQSIDYPYQASYVDLIEDISTAEQMLLHILDYCEEYYPVCLGLYTVLQLFRQQPDDLHSGHGRETLRKIYDLYFQIRIVEDSGRINGKANS